MIDAADLVPPPRGRCITCGRPFGAEPWLVTRYPDGEHLACRDWSRHPFPFSRQIERLLRLLRSLEQARDEVGRLARWLDRARRSWPQSAAVVYDQAERRMERLGRFLEARGLARSRARR